MNKTCNKTQRNKPNRSNC